MSQTNKEKYIEELKNTIERSRFNLDFSKITLKEHMTEESADERGKVQINIDQQEKALKTSERFLAWLES